MSRKLVIALFAIVFAIVSAWADPGGEGGCVNLPGGRSNSRPGMQANQPFLATTVATNGVTLLLPVELHGAAVLVRGVELPFAFWLGSDKDRMHVPAQFLAILRELGLTAFTLDLVTHGGAHMHVLVRVDAGQQVHIRVE
jgi:hypothetical protein